MTNRTSKNSTYYRYNVDDYRDRAHWFDTFSVIIATVKVMFKDDKNIYTAVGHSNGNDFLSNQRSRDTAKQRAINDAIYKAREKYLENDVDKIDYVQPSIDYPKDGKFNTKEWREEEMGVDYLHVVSIKTRYVIDKGEQVKVENWKNGRWLVWRDRNGSRKLWRKYNLQTRGTMNDTGTEVKKKPE